MRPPAASKDREAIPATPQRSEQGEDEDDEENTAPLYSRDPDAVGGRDYHLRRDGENLVYEDTTFVATIRPDGELRFRDRLRKRWRQSCDRSSVEVDAFDLTDTAMRARGEDPYGYEKRRFARHTAALRAKLRKQHLRRVGKRSLSELPLRLTRLWRRYRRRPAKLRRILFELWDECEENRASHDERREARLGSRARRIITRFVAAKLPRGSAMAYRQAELRRLNNKRLSSARFCPYRATSTDR